MIYNQSILFYLLSFVATAVNFFNVKKLLEKWVQKPEAIIATLLILFHPLSIDALLAPNPIRGPLAFGLFIHGLSVIEEKKFLALFFFFVASMCNIGYSLFPIFYALKYRKEIKHYLFPVILYSVMTLFYLKKHVLATVHNPINFLAQHTLNLTAPLYLNFFDFSILPFSISYLIICLGIFLILFLLARKDKRTNYFWPMLILPVIGSIFHQWIEPYKYWDEINLNSSNFLCMAFGLIAIIAIHLPRKFFIAYAVLILALSANWSRQWFPQSNIIRESIFDLPENYPEMVKAKRLLAWQYFYEGKSREGAMLLNALSSENPDKEFLKEDIDFLKRTRR